MFRLLKPRLSISSINKRTIYEKPWPVVYDKEPEKLNILQKFERVKKEWKGEWKKNVQELRSKPRWYEQYKPVSYAEKVVWKFDGTEKSLDQWIVNCDCDYGHGYSTAKLELSSNGTGIFHGVLDTTIPKNGQTTASGYCNITSTPKLKSFKRIAPNNWLRYNELVLRVRGDGRCYLINLLCDKRFDVTRLHAHNYLMYTRGGPHWQVVRIPFSKFVFTNKAQVHEIQFPIVPVNVSNLGITIADKISGPFRLEIDHISICFNPTIFEASAYEMYKVYRG